MTIATSDIKGPLMGKDDRGARMVFDNGFKKLTLVKPDIGLKIEHGIKNNELVLAVFEAIEGFSLIGQKESFPRFVLLPGYHVSIAKNRNKLTGSKDRMARSKQAVVVGF
jgi:hypothetical protein